MLTWLDGYSENPRKRQFVTLVGGLSVVFLAAILPPDLEWIWLWVAAVSGIVAVGCLGVIAYCKRKWRREEGE